MKLVYSDAKVALHIYSLLTLLDKLNWIYNVSTILAIIFVCFISTVLTYLPTKCQNTSGFSTDTSIFFILSLNMITKVIANLELEHQCLSGTIEKVYES